MLCKKFYTEGHKAKRKHLTNIQWWLTCGEGVNKLPTSASHAWLSWVHEQLREHDQQLLQAGWQQEEQLVQWRSAVSALVSEAPTSRGSPREELEQWQTALAPGEAAIAATVEQLPQLLRSRAQQLQQQQPRPSWLQCRLRQQTPPPAYPTPLASAEAAAARSEQPGCGLSMPVADLLELRSAENDELPVPAAVREQSPPSPTPQLLPVVDMSIHDLQAERAADGSYTISFTSQSQFKLVLSIPAGHARALADVIYRP